MSSRLRLALALALLPLSARAQTPDNAVRSGSDARVSLSGYAEVGYQWNFNAPSNGLTNFRGFDTQHNSVNVQNVVLDATGTLGPVSARLALQVGSTPETYYLAEPDRRSAGSVGRSDRDVWKYLQQAIVAWRAPVGRGLLVEAGVFLSPIGPEGMAIKDQWNWSRSNLFFGLPFYHTGLRLSYPTSERVTLTLAGFNGWNSVGDNNEEKSVMLQVAYTVTDRVTFNALYFGGVERAHGDPTRAGGSVPWRSLFDTYLQVQARPWLALMVHANAGFEPGALGTAWWVAGALYARARLRPWLYLAARGDVFHETPAQQGGQTSGSIFWPGRWVASGTATLEARPHANVSLRLEFRHDEAEAEMYFRGLVGTDASGAFVPNARTQDTLTAGMTAWF
jgi:hypothetical protein